VTFRLLGAAELTEAVVGRRSLIGNVSRAVVRGAAAEQLGKEFSDGANGCREIFNGERGYGFIKPDDGDATCSFISPLQNKRIGGLNEGQRISFNVEPDKKGKGPKL
jgi:CspA family cold shock protein